MRVVLAHVFVIASLMQSPIDRQASDSCVFPGTATTCEGPGNLWLLEWREPSADRPHELLLRKSGHSRMHPLPDGERGHRRAGQRR